MVNLEHFRVFYTVAKCGSLSKAAQQLFVSQPAVSQSIKTLEVQLDTVLFIRNYRGIQLSPEGASIFKRVEDALALLDSAENDLLNKK